MSNILQLFPKKLISELTESTGVPEEQHSYEWRKNNQIVSDTFSTLSVYQKQEILDQVLLINNELHDLVIKLKKEKEL